MRKYKMAAVLGTIIMGISSFVACLAQTSAMIAVGNVGLILSIAVMTYGFNTWQP